MLFYLSKPSCFCSYTRYKLVHLDNKYLSNIFPKQNNNYWKHEAGLQSMGMRGAEPECIKLT